MSRPGKIAGFILPFIFKKPATLNYPQERSGMPQGFRGKVKFNPAICIGCTMCVRDCPSQAIEIKKIAEKQFELEMDLGKCIYCGQCVDSCPKKALAITTEFELARLDHKKLKIIINAETENNSTK
jgi:formate hydrogenlyase subunit 6/NADH:ubiquinone oxidoreductase subunit I